MPSTDTILHDPTTAWRAIVLYGQNTATYKIALAWCIEQFVSSGFDRISLPQLAEAFLDLYRDRLQAGKPQLLLPGRLTVMERMVALHEQGIIARDEAIARVAQHAFGDVLPRFHTVYDRPVPVPFYERTSEGGLVLTDAAFAVFASSDADQLGNKLNARWDLLEAAFALKRASGRLVNDARMVNLLQGYERANVTRLTPVLRGYQQGRCFYCGEVISAGDGHVDHVIPRQFIQHDEVWNLVLAHGFCNQQKSDQLPSQAFFLQLVERNEHLIASSHPLRHDVIAKLGTSRAQRRKAVQRAVDDARVAIPYTWSGVAGFEPATSAFYRNIVRSFAR